MSYIDEWKTISKKIGELYTELNKLEIKQSNLIDRIKRSMNRKSLSLKDLIKEDQLCAVLILKRIKGCSLKEAVSLVQGAQK